MQTTPDLSSAFQRLAVVLEDELQALSTRGFDDLPSIIERKSRLLLEITRLRKYLSNESMGVHSEEIRKVVDLLERNKRALGSHLRAAASISQIIRSTISDQTWDGTYSPNHTAKS